MRGGVIFSLTKPLQSFSFSKGTKIVLALFKWACWVLVIAYMWLDKKDWEYDIFVFAVMGIAVALSFSGQCIDAPVYNNRIVIALGKFSIPLYLGHWSFCEHLERLLPSEIQTEKVFLLYILCAVISAAVIMLAANKWRKVRSVVTEWLKIHIQKDF